jgi:hypothetical protein
MTIVRLEIRPDDEALRADVEEVLVDAPAAALEHTYFVVATRFVVDGEELLAYPGVYEAWRPLPLLGFAPRLSKVARDIADGETTTISLMDGGTLELGRKGRTVIIRASLTGAEVTVARARLVHATADFADEVCAYVVSAAPAIACHAAWGTWCGDVKPPAET